MSLYDDARWHPIVWVVSMLGIPIDRLGKNAMTCCPCHEQQPKMTVILHQHENDAASPKANQELTGSI